MQSKKAPQGRSGALKIRPSRRAGDGGRRARGGGQDRTAACECRAASSYRVGRLGQLKGRPQLHSAALGAAIQGL